MLHLSSFLTLNSVGAHLSLTQLTHCGYYSFKMPRAFLIKKKKCARVCDVSVNDENDFPKTKKRKSYEAMTFHQKLKTEEQSECEELTGSGVSTSPPSSGPYAPPHFLSLSKGEAALRWIRPFLHPAAPCWPLPFPYVYYAPEVAHPPSPTYPSQISPYTPPHNEPSSRKDKLASGLSEPALPVSLNTSNRLYSSITSLGESEVKTGTSGADKPRRTCDSARYQCSECQKSYSTYSGLSKHQQFHCAVVNKRTFSCKYCEKVYQSLGALKMHIRTHTLPCKCDLCGKAFSRPWLLQGHIRTHTGEKPFSCSHCDRAFADRSNLRAHLQTHSEVKKYSCKTCTKTFSRMSLLLKHEDGNCCNVIQ